MLLYSKSANERKKWYERLAKWIPREEIYQLSTVENARLMAKEVEGLIIIEDEYEEEVWEALKNLVDIAAWTLVVYRLNRGRSPKFYKSQLGEHIFCYEASAYTAETFGQMVRKPQKYRDHDETEVIELLDKEVERPLRKTFWNLGRNEKKRIHSPYPIGSDKRLCMAFFGEPHAVYEVGAILSEKYNREVLILDLDRFMPTADVVTGVDIITKTGYELLFEATATGLNILMDCAKRNSLSKGVFERCSQSPKGLKHLKIITGVYQLDSFEYYQDEYLKMVIDKAVRFYDYVLLKVNSMPYDTFTLQSFLAADKIVAALPLSISQVRAYKQLKMVLSEKQGIEEHKHVWLAYECEKISASEWTFYAALAGQAPTGHILELPLRHKNKRAGAAYCHKSLNTLNECYENFIRELFKGEDKTWDY